MKTLNDVIITLTTSKNIAIVGKESSGKTQAIKEIIRELSLHNTVLVLSNHKEIKAAAFRPDNVDSLYKPKECRIVGLEYLDTPCDYIFIDEFCDNENEIIQNIDKKLAFVKTIKDEPIESLLKTFDSVIEVSKDERGNALFLNIFNLTTHFELTKWQ